MVKQRFITALWWLLSVTVAGLLIAAVQRKKSLRCSDIKVEIEGNEGHVFYDEAEIIARLRDNGADAGKATGGIDLRSIEAVLKKQPWVYNAELFFDNNEVLQVRVKEREPVARVFTVSGASFYIDSSGKRLPLSREYAAHVPVFTSFGSDRKDLSVPDSLLLSRIKQIANYINRDSFWRAQVSQVVIAPKNTFEIIPVVGNQTIKLGTADSLESKFDRLLAFYRQVWSKAGFEKYETVDVSFTGQVVATRRNAARPPIDSALAWRIVSAMRLGVDILKDSSLMMPPSATVQHPVPDTAQ